MFTKVKPKSEDFDKSTLKIDNFFGKDTEENEFNLPSYLFTMQKHFSLRHPNRIMAQIAQQTAQLTAKCENEFNISVSKMQKFLEKIKKLTHVEQNKKVENKKNISKQMRGAISIVHQAINSYNCMLPSESQQRVGEIRLNDMSTPLYRDIIKACATDPQKKNVEKAFNLILEATGLKTPDFGAEKIKSLFYLCEASYKDIVNTQQFCAHYWIPITETVGIWKDQTHADNAKPGVILGGEYWLTIGFIDEEKPEHWQLKMPATKSSEPSENSFFIFSVPEKNICWRNKKTPSEDAFRLTHLPFAEWTVSKHLDTFQQLLKTRDDDFGKYAKMVEVIQTEKKVREFESKEKKILNEQYQKIIDLVYDNLGITLERETEMNSDTFSKSLYNSIFEQTKTDFPTLSAEEQGNKAYTIWRFIQSEIVTSVYLDQNEEITGIVTPEPALNTLTDRINASLQEFSIESSEQLIDLSGDLPFIRLSEIVKANNTLEIDGQIKLIDSIVSALEYVIRAIMEEISFYRARLQKVSSINTDFDVQEVQSKLVTESVRKLQILLNKKLNPKKEAEPIHK